MGEFGRVWEGSRGFARVWDLGGFGRVGGSGRVWEALGRFGRVWEGVGEFGRVCGGSGGFAKVCKDSE